MKLLRESENLEYQFHADIWDLMEKNSDFFGENDTYIIFKDDEDFYVWRTQNIDRDKLKKHILRQGGYRKSDKVESYDFEYGKLDEIYGDEKDN